MTCGGPGTMSDAMITVNRPQTGAISACLPRGGKICSMMPQASAPPRHHQRRGRVSSRARAQRQPALRGHQPQALAPRSVRSDLLRPRGHRESDQRSASWPGNRVHQLQPLPRQSIAGAVERRRLRALPGAASAGRPHGLAIRPGQHPARTPDETRRMGRIFRAAHRAAPARHLLCITTTGRSSPAILALRPHSAVGLAPRCIECRMPDSDRTPVAEIHRRTRTVLDNPSPTHRPPAKSPPRIDITPRHRQTCTHDHENPLLHA